MKRILTILLVLVFSTPLFAFPHRGERGRVIIAKENRRSKRLLARHEAIARARAQFGGEALSAQLVETGEHSGYWRIKLLSNGNVRIVRVDAYTGVVEP